MTFDSIAAFSCRSTVGAVIADTVYSTASGSASGASKSW